MDPVLEEAIVGLIVAVISAVIHKLYVRGWIPKEDADDLLDIILSFIAKAKDGKVTEDEFQAFVDESIPKIAAKSNNKKLQAVVEEFYADVKAGKVSKDNIVAELLKLIEAYQKA